MCNRQSYKWTKTAFSLFLAAKPSLECNLWLFYNLYLLKGEVSPPGTAHLSFSAHAGSFAAKLLNFASLNFSFLPICFCCQQMKKWQEVRQGMVAAIFPEALPVVFTAKNTQGQTVGGFCRDLSPLLRSLRVNRGHVAISVETAPGSLDPSTRERVCMCLCMFFLWVQVWGKGISGEMNQPLSSATRPLTYRARFIETQRSTLTLFSHFSVSFGHFSTSPTSLIRGEQGASSEWEKAVGALCVYVYKWDIEHADHFRHIRTLCDCVADICPTSQFHLNTPPICTMSTNLHHRSTQQC